MTEACATKFVFREQADPALVGLGGPPHFLGVLPALGLHASPLALQLAPLSPPTALLERRVRMGISSSLPQGAAGDIQGRPGTEDSTTAGSLGCQS